jgi:ABC-type multidrug transport system fused ATPase/permease subunit
LIGNALRLFKSNISNLLFIITHFFVNTNYLECFFEFFDKQSEIKINNNKSTKLNNNKNHKITFENVSFKYPHSDVYALKNINITINAGQALLIVGENGAGKSTFVKLLTRLYKPTDGKILIDDINIQEYSYNSYIKLFSALFQDYKLFALSIKENITALNENISDNRFSYAMSTCGMDIKVSVLKDGTDTSLYRIFDENGVEFSGGEMQKLAIARAVYKDAPIIILDEPTSALDPRAEFEIYDSFNKLSHNKTSIYISHRLSSSRFCDIIAVFNKGEIVEYGSHSELMIRNGLYNELYTMQSLLYVNK